MLVVREKRGGRKVQSDQIANSNVESFHRALPRAELWLFLLSGLQRFVEPFRGFAFGGICFATFFLRLVLSEGGLFTPRGRGEVTCKTVLIFLSFVASG
jgi:hypothetical protein